MMSMANVIRHAIGYVICCFPLFVSFSVFMISSIGYVMAHPMMEWAGLFIVDI